MERRNVTGCKKKAAEEGSLILYADESSVPLNPYVSHTYARRGRRPVIKVSSDIHRRIYLASAISSRGELWYCIRNKPFDGVAIVEFLKQLLDKEYSTEKLVLIWDNTTIHNCETTRTFLSTHNQAQRLQLVQLPTYSPELNADEQVWHYLKCVLLKDTTTKEMNQLQTNIENGLIAMKNNSRLIAKFFHHPNVCFYN